MRLYDTISVDDSSVRETADGYLVANVNVARANSIQVYRARELGLTDRDPSAEVRVYRPKSAVFDANSLASIAHRPLTNDHPSEKVTAKTWKALATGNLGGDIVRDGDFVRVPMVMMDAAAIRDFRSGKKELSLGYDAEIEFTDGLTEDGRPYDAIMGPYKVNHLAQCWKARGGPELRIGDDANLGDSKVTLKTLIIDGIGTVECTDAAIAAIQTLQSRMADAATAHTAALGVKDAKIGELTAQVSAKDGEIAGLNQKLTDAVITPAMMDAAVAARATVVDAAKAIIGDTFTADGKTDAAIRKEAVLHKLGDAAKDFNDDAIAGAFKALVPAADAQVEDGVRQVVLDGAGKITDSAKASETARRGMIDSYNPKVA